MHTRQMSAHVQDLTQSHLCMLSYKSSSRVSKHRACRSDRDEAEKESKHNGSGAFVRVHPVVHRLKFLEE